jgi:hypothetical protein
VSTMFDEVAEIFPSASFYNPLVVDTPDDSPIHRITWPAAPGRLLSTRLGAESRWKRADSDRNEQDEYCEWSVLRDANGDILRVTFTSEVPDYYDHLFDTDKELLLELYSQLVGQRVSIDALSDEHGQFVKENEFNTSTEGPIVHLMQRSNNLRAAVSLAVEATILREKDGKLVKHPQTLVLCGNMGDETRHSDPQIASAVNSLAASGFEVTFTDPPGLYLDRLTTTGMQTPDNEDAQIFWNVERGDPDHAVRAFFEIPAERGYSVSDITILGRRIEFGAQLAERVHVRIEAMSKPSNNPPMTPEPCVG